MARLRRPAFPLQHRSLLVGFPLLALLAIAAGCQKQNPQDLQVLQQRQEQLELKIQQLEQRLNTVAPGAADRKGKPPAGPIKSLTLRSGSSDDRLRIYWADGTTSDLPCTREQGTLVCG
ncbi:MAG: hypothetical protein VKN17_03430 [Cyanobacteriota bacterium]|jgi:hypothetical protein|nr:hypothetical protein [Synechococcus sp. FGCU3]MEB3104814.1 hypothetical protein [Cyanobacteriota bacterium]